MKSYRLTALAIAVTIISMGVGSLTHKWQHYQLEIFLVALLSGLAWVRSAVLAMGSTSRWRIPGIEAEVEPQLWNYLAAVLTAALAALQYFGAVQ
jgi:hypothetical protein